jgi:hypothetical protein
MVIKLNLGLNADSLVGIWPFSQLKATIHGPNMASREGVLRGRGGVGGCVYQRDASSSAMNAELWPPGVRSCAMEPARPPASSDDGWTHGHIGVQMHVHVDDHLRRGRRRGRGDERCEEMMARTCREENQKAKVGTVVTVHMGLFHDARPAQPPVHSTSSTDHIILVVLC